MDATISYYVDHAYLIHENDFPQYIPGVDGWVFNGDFEISTESAMWLARPWYFGGNQQQTMETIYAADAPSGRSYLRMSQRTGPNDRFMHDIQFDASLQENPAQTIEIKFFGKFGYQDGN